MKTGVKYTQVDYFKENNKLTCFLSWEIPYSFFGGKKVIMNNMKLFTQLDKIGFIKENSISFQTFASSKLNKDDNYDEKFGKRLALTRAQRKAFKTSKRVYTLIYNTISKELFEIDKLFNGCDYAVSKLTEHINNLIEEKYE